MMKNILKSKKGISPILATLLLIVIAVSAVIVTYAWVMTFTESTTGSAGAVLTVDNVRFYNSNASIDIIIRNSGMADATIDTVYKGSSASDLAPITSGITFNPATQIVATGSTITITMTGSGIWTEGQTYHFSIGTEEGVTFTFQREA